MLRGAVFLATCFATCFAWTATADEWPQWRGPQRDGVWRETGILERFPAAQIAIKWRAAISSGFSGPTVADGRVYVSDRVVKPEEIERVHCFDRETGKRLWTHSYACKYSDFGYRAGPRASVLIDGGRAYSLGAAGHLVCLDAARGTLQWRHDLRAEYKIRMPLWGIAAAPVVEGELLIVQIGGQGEACLCAFDKKSGQPRWQALGDVASYAAPIVIEQAGQRVLVCHTGDRVVGVDARSGRLFWSHPIPWQSWPIGIPTPVVHGDLLLISDAHQGAFLFRLGQAKPEVTLLWNRRRQDAPDKKALHCLNSTPMIHAEHIYGADQRGVLRCLRLSTGEQLWEDKTATTEGNFATIHLVRNGDRTWLFTERGELIVARLTPQGFEPLSRAKLIEPTLEQARLRGGVAWSHPAFAYRHVFARNDKELVCADLSAQ
jgi:outer membrane protein assembly factor BamB